MAPRVKIDTGSRAFTHVPRSRELLLAVSDTGIGIAEDQQALLFAPFVQARQERPGRFGGTGLGLSICRRLMTMMGGTIELASQPGQGSRFTMRVRLPVARPPLEAVAPTPVHEPDTDDLLGLRVLVVMIIRPIASCLRAS
jgi:two-component system, NarL family, sensor histidine kinase EvgS